MKPDFFPQRPEAAPTIYAYELLGAETHKGLLKVGYTDRTAQTRVAEQLKTSGVKYRIVLEQSAMRSDGSAFDDHAVHRVLRNGGLVNTEGEWFRCTVADVEQAICAVRERKSSAHSRTQRFAMRPEQAEAVEKTAAYFNGAGRDGACRDGACTVSTSHFLWNCKMRFGKTFATYQLAKRQGWKKMLVLTFKPAVESAWKEDLNAHVDFEGWQFVSKRELERGFIEIEPDKPLVCFGSFQDFLRTNKEGGIKAKNEWVHHTEWDCIVLDEYHYGAWHESTKEFIGAKEAEFIEGEEKFQDFDEQISPLKTKHYLYLSGTPFRAIGTGEFIEDQIFNWTYSDEQRAKNEWTGENNPYAALPRLLMMTYQLPENIEMVAAQGEFNEFDLNVFFKAEGSGTNAKFQRESEVQKWLDLIRGGLLETTIDNLKLGAKKPPFPFSDSRLLQILTHTLWFLPDVAACHAMANLLAQRQNVFYHDYRVIVAAGTQAGIGLDALAPVYKAMGNPLETKTITLSCGKLTTGVSIKPWSGIFMLRNLSSPETYFQAAFRVQTPWTIKNPDDKSPNSEAILKEECYIFDFAPNRALRQISDYACRLDVNETSPEKKVEDFVQFLPVLSYDGSTMKQIDAAEILDMAMSGTSATLLARRWESALLVNVDSFTLQKILNNEKAMQAIMNIEGFRALGNNVLETIVNKSNKIKAMKAKSNETDLTPTEKKELSDEEKQYKNMRKQVQEKLIKFATRIPIFMYLTDYREHTLRDVITQLEPALFRKVTGLTISDFELLVSLNVFNSTFMNDAVYKFKRYEDSSLLYIGIQKHNEEKIGLFDTVVSREG
ncbi:MAG: GIY-YIG nuclease family protein [Bacteroidales bacterium]|jgi:hypothetical protein|nr:GIY-YIG nuclease family protein [Bacteroidales bacterium]